MNVKMRFPKQQVLGAVIYSFNDKSYYEGTGLIIKGTPIGNLIKDVFGVRQFLTFFIGFSLLFLLACS